VRIVIPLLPAEMLGMRIERLHLSVEVDGRPLVLATNLMTSVRRDQLGPKVGSLAERRTEIMAAVDFLQQGF
jgi:toxin CcdB